MDALRKAFERCARALRPSFGRDVRVSRTRISHGLLCEIEEGAWKMTADLPPQLGGGGAAPAAGVFGRAALGSGLAIGYMLRAATLQVPIASLEVELHADGDSGSLLGVAEGPRGYHEVRYSVTVESSASEDEVRRVLDDCDGSGPSLHVFAFRRVP
jgi:hypothetical protein